MLALCLALRDRFNLAAVTNDIFTREDAEFLVRHRALPTSRIRAIETGGCPHAAVREDISANLAALEDLHASCRPSGSGAGAGGADLLLIESGGDNLAANYSRELADYIIYVIDVSVRLCLSLLRRAARCGEGRSCVGVSRIADVVCWCGFVFAARTGRRQDPAERRTRHLAIGLARDQQGRYPPAHRAHGS